MALRVIQGALLRFNARISSTETTNFAAGRILSLNAVGDAFVMTGNTGIIGLCDEDRVPTTQFSPTATSQAGRPSGEMTSMILDIAVVENDQISGNSVWVPGANVYHDAAGRLSSSTAVDARIVGKALLPSTVGGSVTYLHDVQY